MSSADNIMSKGSCHCGRIAFEVPGAPENVTACNCSICQRKGILMWFVPREQLKLLTPEENSSVYLFNKHRIKHRFCPVCGIHAYGEALDPQGRPTAAINARCIEGVDLESLKVSHFDGRKL